MITDLIPQRPPIVMVDAINPLSATTTLTIREDNWFVEGGTFLEAGLVEHAAQSAAALVGLATQQRGEQPHIGYIGAVQDFVISSLPHVGDTLTTEVHVVAIVDEITLVEITTHSTVVHKKVNNVKSIATGRLKVFITE